MRRQTLKVFVERWLNTRKLWQGAVHCVIQCPAVSRAGHIRGFFPRQKYKCKTQIQIHKYTKYTNKICVIHFPAVRRAGHIRGPCPRQALFLLCLLSPTCHHLIVRRVKNLQTEIFKTVGYAVFFFR